jgi:TonB family protein
MSYKSLLFCPDEKTARMVTQVLTELEFTVELSNEPFASVKKLTDEHFDALVVDCQNEQDASLLFKGARNSSLNHSSLSVAVVEGQAGVAKAFRIGANLVLTKPINIEQSKSTLRVARGLLRKNEAKLVTAAAATVAKSLGVPSRSAAIPAKPLVKEPATFSAVSPARMSPAVPPAPAPAVPFAALELDQETMPAPEPSEAALLESMPSSIDGKSAPVGQALWAPRSQGQAEPIAASTGGHATAAAPALAKPAELKLAGASPMVTQEPIIKESGATEHFPVSSVPVPTFAALEMHGSGSGVGKRLVKTVAVLLMLGAGGYVAWRKLQPQQDLHNPSAVQTTKQAVDGREAGSVSAPAAQSPAEPENISATASPVVSPELTTVPSSLPTTTASARTAPDNIRVQELPTNTDQKSGSASKPQPIVVHIKPGSAVATKQAQQPMPPSLPPAASNSDAALANLVSTDAPVPKPAPGSLRLSQGVSQGLVVRKIAPVYTAMALQLRKEGTVELMARINKAGGVTGVQVLSGDLMLAKSAVEAVRQWKYRPYLLNGEPVEIETQITVNFRLPH